MWKTTPPCMSFMPRASRMKVCLPDLSQHELSSRQSDARFVAAINHLCHDQGITASWRPTIGPGCPPAAPSDSQIALSQRSRTAAQIARYSHDPRQALGRCQKALSAPGRPSGVLCGKVWKRFRSCPVKIANLGLSDAARGLLSRRKLMEIFVHLSNTSW